AYASARAASVAWPRSGSFGLARLSQEKKRETTSAREPVHRCDDRLVRQHQQVHAPPRGMVALGGEARRVAKQSPRGDEAESREKKTRRGPGPERPREPAGERERGVEQER